jgi:hypothetical protein
MKQSCEDRGELLVGEYMAAENASRLSNDAYIPDSHLKPNDFVFASLNATARMMDMLAMVFSVMKEDDWFDDDGNKITPTYTFTNKELLRWFEMEKVEALAATLRTPAEALAGKTVGVFDKQKHSFEYYPIFTVIKYRDGKLTMKPNGEPEMRESFIINAKNSGFAKIDNHLFLSLKDTHSKRLLDMLSRFKDEVRSLHPISVSRLQHQFGVIGQNNKVLKKSYLNPYSFVRGVIKPALSKLDSSPKARGVLEITKGSSGELGYELVDFDTSEPKILFHCRWLKNHSHDDLETAAKTTIELTTEIQRIKHRGEDVPIDILEQLKQSLDVLGKDTESQKIALKISEKKKQLAIQRETEKKKKSLKSLSQVDTLLDSGFLDDI